MRGTVIAVDPTEKDVVVRTDAGAQRVLDAFMWPSISSMPTR